MRSLRMESDRFEMDAIDTLEEPISVPDYVHSPLFEL